MVLTHQSLHIDDGDEARFTASVEHDRDMCYVYIQAGPVAHTASFFLGWRHVEALHRVLGEAMTQHALEAHNEAAAAT